MVTIFQAKHGTVAYSSSAVTWETVLPLSSGTMTANVNEVKDCTLTIPEQEVEKIDLLGYTVQTIGTNSGTTGSSTGVVPGTFQNSMLQIKSVGNWKFEGTGVFTGDEQFMQVLGCGSSSAITGGYTRYAVGSLVAGGAWSKILNGALRCYLNNGSEEATVVLTNPAVTKLGPVKPTGADGYFEVEFAAECLARDGALEYKD